MKASWSRFAPVRPSARVAVTTLAAAALALGGCGDDEEESSSGEETETLAIEMTVTESEESPSELTVPDGIEAGVADITLTNEGEAPHSAQFIRTEGEHDAEEVLEGLDAASSGEPFPEWFFAGGGTGTVSPGESATVTQAMLPDSTYWVVDDEVRGEPEVVELGTTEAGAEPGEIEQTENVVRAVDFAFETESLTAGEPVTLVNEGDEPHHMIAVPFTGDATIEDVETFFQTEEGQPPVDFDSGEFTSVLEGGTSQVTAATLDAGRYALVCFISNRDGGPPHIELGMINEVEVE